MVTGQWGKPSEILLDLTVAPDGTVHGIVHPGREHASIRNGRFDAATGTLELEGALDEQTPYRIHGRLEGRRLLLQYRIGPDSGSIELVRIEDYRPPRLTLADRARARLADAQRAVHARGRPKAADNARRLRERGESLDSISVREATVADIPALSALHVELWNATYRTSQGPTVATRSAQWHRIFERNDPRDFVILLEDGGKRLIGFAFGVPHRGEFAGELSKIYLRWEYHGLGLGRRLMMEVARRFLERGIHSFILHAERSNPTIGFYDRMGGERLYDERGLFSGSYGWRDVRTLLDTR